MKKVKGLSPERQWALQKGTLAYQLGKAMGSLSFVKESKLEPEAKAHFKEAWAELTSMANSLRGSG
jgi:hypothetical protein